MRQIIEGKVIVVGDNIDTDQIYPGRYLALTDPKEIGSHCLEGVDEGIAANFPAGGIVAAGRNFGCGSSREHAPIALIHMGASAVLADSFARIFFRNAVNLGLLPIICRGISRRAKPGRYGSRLWEKTIPPRPSDAGSFIPRAENLLEGKACRPACTL